ncbi:hypothetical protein ERJ75_000978800 [Trypanosoma vivax]|nr:hypothetical protein ERJ75_000978800 [Trypanosoma vivax]
MSQRGAMLDEGSWLAQKCGFIGAPFNQENGTVRPRRKNDKGAKGGAAIGKTRGGGIGAADAANGVCRGCARRRAARGLFLSKGDAAEASKT